MSRYSKNLSGLNQKVIVGTSTYTNDTTYEAFVSNAPDGEVGVFLSTGAVRTTLLTAGLEFFIAQKRDGFVNKTPILKYDDLFRKTQTDYSAPVKQVTYIGYNGSAGDLGFDFTLATSTNVLEYGLSIIETTPGNQPFPIQAGHATVASSTTDEYDTLAAIVSQINGDLDFAQYGGDSFVRAEIVSNGSITEFVATADPILVQGSAVVNFVAAITVAAGAFVVFRDTVYKVAVGVAAGTVITLDRPYQGVSETIDVDTTTDQGGTIAYTAGTTLLGIKFTSKEFESHFKVRGTDGFAYDTITEDTAWALGSGAGAQIYELETIEGFIFDGAGSVVNAGFSQDFGIPTPVASPTGTYHQIFLDFAPSIKPSAALPIYEQKQIQRILIAAPSSGTLESTLGTVFGV